ncbi:MAG: GMP synthase (glutamine-hydrolyzing) [Verrucomicrobia bacterium]|nr:MAG: GMP synthase (glutamine-hydrolyzing) [Verrucomicrobiota bacterium]
MSETLVILDFGSQYTQVIARRIREMHVYSKVLPFNTKIEELKKLNLKGIILSGGPMSVLTEGSPRPDPEIFNLGVPILGICYGLQVMGLMLGGEVAKSTHREYGHGMLKLQRPGALFRGLESTLRVWNSHGDRLIRQPEGFEAIASTENSDLAVVEDIKRYFYALQFHPEVVHTEGGQAILKNFVFEICGCHADWVMAEIIAETVDKIRDTVGKSRVILGLSGGVDSSVVATLVHRAIGDQLTCVFVDNGLLRKNESQEVQSLFGGFFQMDLKVVDAREKFLNALAGVVDPEQKRKIIGRLFIEVFDDVVKTMKDVEYLAQGTIYPDIIESVPIDGSPASTIKSHHNVGGLPEKMKLKLLEPIRELFKDEVRILGGELGIPNTLLWRHPFPGPGLAVRVIGEIKEEFLEILREADSILVSELKRSGYYSKVWQAFCVFMPIRTVGVKGDERTHDYTIAVRVVESEDAMTADWAKLPNEVLQKISSRIVNEVHGIGRVVYDITSKPPGTIEWE